MNSTCLDLPTVEECLHAASVIQDVCLRQCVEAQCNGVEVKCDESILQRCQELNQEKQGKVGGYVIRRRQTCLKPRSEIAWCQLPMSRECRAKAMVHELAHSCGWRHDEGGNVPGGDGELKCI